MKIATLEDLSEVVEMGMKFISTTGYKEHSNEEAVTELVRGIITGSPTSGIVLLKTGVGMLVGISSVFVFGSGLIASEVGWWVEPDSRGSGAGKELVEAFEYWAKEKAGCTLITLTSLDDSVGKYYEKKGYKLYERAYMKVF